jgi:hypothetical protein
MNITSYSIVSMTNSQSEEMKKSTLSQRFQNVIDQS